VPLLNLLKRKALRRAESRLRVGIPRALNIWSTHRFWIRFLRELGIPPGNIIFSSETSEEQYREHGKGRIGMDSCYPVKCLAGHIGELLASRRVDVLLVPMIYSLPSFLKGHVIDNLSCTRVMMGPENIKAGFLREGDEFSRAGVRYVAPFVSFAEPYLLPGQLYESLKDIFDVSYEEVERAVRAGLKDLEAFDRKRQTLSHGSGHRTRDRRRVSEVRIPCCMGTAPSHRSRSDGVALWRGGADGCYKASLRHLGCMDFLLQRQHK